MVGENLAFSPERKKEQALEAARQMLRLLSEELKDVNSFRLEYDNETGVVKISGPADTAEYEMTYDPQEERLTIEKTPEE